MDWTKINGDKLLEPVVCMVFTDYTYLQILGSGCLRWLFGALQDDMIQAIARSKPTVNEADLEKQRAFTRDFGQEG